MSARTLSDSTIVVAAREALAGAFGDELVILNLRDGVYYGLEDVGARVWTLLQGPVSLAAICDVLVAEYDVAPARCGRDVRALLGELAEQGLIEVSEAA